MKQFVRCALALALAVASGAASALGLGEIVVRSSLDQPLLAEIPIISSDPGELERLQARLASPETFARVGLQPPQGVVSGLRFMVGLDNAGNPVVRVTSSEPVNQAALTFLVEVDWGQGRLVREYSALLDAPRTVAAPVQPPIEAPQAAPSNIIEREPLATAVEPAPETDESASEPMVAEISVSPEPEARLITAEPAPVPRPIATARPARRVEGDSYQVAGGDTLSAIAASMPGARGFSLNQRMIALLQANPEAFIDGNIHRLKAGAVLRIPGADTIGALDRAEVNALVREQTRQWRQPVAAVPQPAEAGRIGAAASADGASVDGSSTGPAVADARLEIVPPGASDATSAGNQSGISAGGEGNMLRQDMQAQENLAAREAELEEMKARVAELETLQEQQQKLIELKDSELAEVQQRLAQSPQEAEASVLPWFFGGFGLLLAALAGGWALRQRKPKPVFRAPDSDRRASLAAGFATSGATAAAAGEGETEVTPEPELAGAAIPEAPVVVEDAAAPAVEADGADGADEGMEFEPAATWQQPAVASSPAWHGPADRTLAEVTATEAAGSDSGGGGNERLELARAYIALGDHDSARQLLAEVRLHGDLAARQQAMQMLRELE
ncbi:FimV/HubP family polar landmark protein [Marilutibacter alkalisoli]|uniref:FimV/HubP family polar landmark protein n=1 Tax=Marilutibacter alkalisoli TaxID=2591633 RepID=UPI001FC9927D|nr:FimV/HubP family polar landmark protein [Lysobacter alkalisoli]